MARYKDAIFWIVANDDTEFLDDGPDSSMSVTASFAADMFGKTDAQVRASAAGQTRRYRIGQKRSKKVLT
jgi:hypothetical protein